MATTNKKESNSLKMYPSSSTINLFNSANSSRELPIGTPKLIKKSMIRFWPNSIKSSQSTKVLSYRDTPTILFRPISFKKVESYPKGISYYPITNQISRLSTKKSTKAMLIKCFKEINFNSKNSMKS